MSRSEGSKATRMGWLFETPCFWKLSECIETVPAWEREIGELLAAIGAEPTPRNQQKPTSMSASHDDHAKHKKGQRKSATHSGKAAIPFFLPQEIIEDVESLIGVPETGEMLENLRQSKANAADQSEILALLRELASKGGKGLKSCLRIGECLLRMMKRMGVDDFVEFVHQHLKLEPEIAQDYIRLYRERDRLPKSEMISDWTLDEAIKWLKKARGMVAAKTEKSGQGSSGPEATS